MTNQELNLFFKNLTLNTENIFDIICALKDKKFIKDYKKSAFYLITKIKPLDAYRLYTSFGGKIDSIVKAIAEIDQEAVSGLLSQITDHFSLSGLTDGLSSSEEELMSFLTAQLRGK